MKKALLTIAILATAITACSSGTKTVYVPQTTSPLSSPTTTQAPPNIEDVYLITIRGEYPGLSAYTDAYLLELGYTICDSIDGGMTLLQMVQVIQQAGVDPEMVGYIAGAAISAFCTWNMWFIEQAQA